MKDSVHRRRDGQSSPRPSRVSVGKLVVVLVTAISLCQILHSASHVTSKRDGKMGKLGAKNGALEALAPISVIQGSNRSLIF